MLKKEVLNFLKANNFVPSKKMGQNFLINQAIMKNIVNSSNIDSCDNVIEIGPGLGAITKYIKEKTNNLLLIELDKRLYQFLCETYKDLWIINDDILKINLDSILNEKKWESVKVVANLPYSISSKIILMLLILKPITEINILVQKEMAQRLLAKKNSKEYNAFSVLVQMFSDIKLLLKVGSNEFLPKPEIDSWFIKINKNNKYKLDFDKINEFLKICFMAKRKKLINNLLTKFNKEIVIKVFDELNFDHNIRAEQLDLDDFNNLFLLLEKYNG